MALQYLNLEQPQYIPSYTPLQPEMLAQQSQMIEQQTQQVRERSQDILDLAGQNIQENFTGLGERDQQYVQEQMEGLRSSVEELGTERETRSALPFLERETRKFQENLQYHQKASQMKANAISMLEENDQLPTDVKMNILNEEVGVEYDEQGKPVGVKGGYNQRDLNIAANWEDWTEDVEKFTSGMKAQITEDADFQVSPEQTARYRRKIKQLGGDDISAATVNFLMNHPKYKEQLELLGRTEIGRIQKQFEGEGEKSPVRINQRGEVVADVPVPIQDSNGKKKKIGEDENGNPIYEEKTVTQNFGSPAEYKATEIGMVYGEQKKQFELSYENVREGPALEERKNASDRFRMTGRAPIDFEEQPEFQEYLTGLYDKMETFNNDYGSSISRSESALKAALGEEDLELRVDDETGDFEILRGSTSYSVDELEEELGDNYNTVKDRMRAVKESKNKARRYEQEIDSAKDTIINRLARNYEDDPELQEFILDNFEIDDKGDLQIPEAQDLPPELVGSSISSMERVDERVNPKVNEFKNSDSKLAVLDVEVTRQLGREGRLIKDRRPMIARKENGEINFYEVNSNFNNLFNEVTENTMNQVINRQREDTASMKITPGKEQDDMIISTFKQDRALLRQAGEGDIVDIDGNEVTEHSDLEGGYFHPIESWIGKDGRAIWQGTIRNSRDEDVGDPVYLRGDLAESAARNVYGEEFEMIQAQRSLDSVLPTAYREEKILSEGELINLMARVVGEDGRYKTLPGEVKIKATGHKTGGNRIDDFTIYIDGEPIIVNSADDIPYELARKTEEYYNKN